MKNLALIFSFILLFSAGWYLILFNFFKLSFNWLDLLGHFIISIIVVGTILIVGNLINRKFYDSLSEFLAGNKQTLNFDKNLLRTFGLLIILLFPLLLYFMLLGVFAAITSSKYILNAISHSPRIPIGLIIGLAIICFGTGIGVFYGFLNLFFPSRKKTTGIQIKRSEQKLLWDLIDEIAKKVKLKPINKIFITPNSEIGVYLEGGLLKSILGLGEKVLEIGIPSLYNLTIDEFKTILAHEYAHFSNRDTQWAPFTYAMEYSLIYSLNTIPGPTPTKDTQNVGFIRGIIALNPAYWILFLFMHIFFKITNAFSRVREVMADIISIKLYGGEAFSNGLIKVALNDYIFREIVKGKYLPQLLMEGKVISNFYSIMDYVYKQFDNSELEKLIKTILSYERLHDNIYDTHPSLEIRLTYACKFPQKFETNKNPINTIFNDWENINKKITELYISDLFNRLKKLNNKYSDNN